MSYTTHFAQHLVIDYIPLSTPAWEVTNLQVLMSGPATRGENRLIPGATGVRPLRHRPTEKTVTLEMAVFGDREPDGTPRPDAEAGVWANWMILRGYFNSLITEPGDSVTPATLYYAGGTLSGPVQVLAYEIGDTIGPGNMFATLDLNLVNGMLT